MSDFFVVGPDQIVAQDLADAIRANEQQARVTVFRSPQEAIEALDALQPMAVILHREPEGFANTALGKLLAAGAVPHGFLSMSERDDREFVLASPFTEATVEELLRGLLGQGIGAGGDPRVGTGPETLEPLHQPE
ncbi:MAG: hypothetical protein EON48_05800 [Acetobacteraceae bacterium]|nr:MAG: hypothetical protein EON48_05800 [Acetobacteraceae bacterium]